MKSSYLCIAAAFMLAVSAVPEVCQEYETEVLKFSTTVLGDNSEAIQAHHDAVATDVDGPYNMQWSDANWPGQDNPHAPPVAKSKAPIEKEWAVTPRNMGGLAADPAPAASSFIEFARVARVINTDGSLVKLEPFQAPNQKEANVGIAAEEAANVATKEANIAAEVRNVAATKFLHKQIQANGALTVLKQARDACTDGAYRAHRKGSDTCAETCDRVYPPSKCDNPMFAACVKGCVSFSEHYLSKGYDKHWLDNAGAARDGQFPGSTGAQNGNSLPRDIPTNEHLTDDRFDLNHP